MGVNSLPKTVTRQRRGCDLNPGPCAPESSALTTRLPSHPIQWCSVNNKCGYPLQAVWTRSSDVGAKIEAPKGVGVGRACPLPAGGGVWRGGYVPSAEFFFAFGSQDGEFWCILGRILAAELLVYRLC